MPETAPVYSIESAIHVIRGQRVMLDSDLARFYGVTTKVLNQALQRNADRFPIDFAFQLTREEFTNLRSQIVTSSLKHGGRRYQPWAFTEHGVIMLASVLSSPIAVQASVRIVRTFVRLRELSLRTSRFRAVSTRSKAVSINTTKASLRFSAPHANCSTRPPKPSNRKSVSMCAKTALPTA